MLQYNKAAGKTLLGLTERRKAEQALFLKPAAPDPKPTSAEPVHIQLNYQPGKKYKSAVDNLRIRTKKPNQPPAVLPNSGILGILKKGTTVRNLATARVENQIWMYTGLDKRNREQWICADTGDKSYVK